MNIALCLCTIWSSIHINLSDGGKLIEDTYLKTVTYYVGTIGGFEKSYQSTFFIHCAGPCMIVDVRATLSKGDLKLIGYYGDGDNQFCQGLRTNGKGIAECGMLVETGLLKARIYFSTYDECHNVSLTAKGYHLRRFSDNPQPAQDNLQSVVYNIGSINNYEASYWMVCRGPCEIHEAFINVKLGHIYGLYGDSNSEEFCSIMSYNDGTGIEKCIMKKTKGLPRAQFNILCLVYCDNLVLTVRGLNLIGIEKKPLSPKKITTHVGTLDKNQHMEFTLRCSGKKCTFLQISATFNTDGDVRIMGPVRNAIDSYNLNTNGTKGPKKCPESIKSPKITLYGHNKSVNVAFTVTALYLENVYYDRTYKRQP